MAIVQVSRIQLREETAVRIRKGAETAKMLLSDYLEACVTLFEQYGHTLQPADNDEETEKPPVATETVSGKTSEVATETAPKAATEPAQPKTEYGRNLVQHVDRMIAEGSLPVNLTQKSLEAGFILALTLAGCDSPNKLSKQALTDLASVYTKAEAFAGSYKNFAYHIYQCWAEAYAALVREEHTTADFLIVVGGYENLSEFVDCSRIEERTPETVSAELERLRKQF